MPLPHELSARTPTTSTAYRSAESCTGQRPEMPVLMLRPYSSAESSASPAAHKDADKRIGLHGRLDHPPNLGQDTSLQTQLGSYQRYQIADYGRLTSALWCRRWTRRLPRYLSRACREQPGVASSRAICRLRSAQARERCWARSSRRPVASSVARPASSSTAAGSRAAGSPDG